MMKRAELQKAFEYFCKEVQFENGPYGNKQVLPYMQAAMNACAAKLDELDKKEHDRLKAIVFFKEESDRLERAPQVNGCEMKPEWAESLRMCEIAIALLEECKDE